MRLFAAELQILFRRAIGKTFMPASAAVALPFAENLLEVNPEKSQPALRVKAQTSFEKLRGLLIYLNTHGN